MEYKSDTAVEWRQSRLCRLSVLTHGVPHSDDGRRMCREYIAGVVSMLSGCPYVRMTGRVDVYKSSSFLSLYTGACEAVDDFGSINSHEIYDSYFMFSFYMHCNVYNDAQAAVFLNDAIRIVYGNAQLFGVCKLRRVFFGEYWNTENNYGLNAWGRAVFKNEHWHMLDSWERIRGTVAVRHAMCQSRCNHYHECLNEQVSALHGTAEYGRLVAAFIRDEIISKHFIPIWRYNCIMVDDFGDYQTFAIWTYDSDGVMTNNAQVAVCRGHFLDSERVFNFKISIQSFSNLKYLWREIGTYDAEMRIKRAYWCAKREGKLEGGV